MLDWFAVLGEGTGWGCTSEHGDKTYYDCYNSTTAPLNLTALSEEEYCE